MADIVKFTTADEVTDEMPINNDVDSDTLKKVIGIAQEQHIQSAIGSNLYKHIKSLVLAGTIGDAGNADYKELLDDYIIPTLMRYTYYRALRVFKDQFTDKGAQKRRGEASEGSADVNVHGLRKDALNDAEFFEDLMKKFICDKGAAVFPEYFICNPEDVRPKSGQPFNGIVY